MLLATKKEPYEDDCGLQEKEYSFILTEHNGLRIQEEIGHWVHSFKDIFKTIFTITVRIL